MHQCYRCKRTPSEAAFGSYRGGLRDTCKDCRSFQNKRLRLQKPKQHVKYRDGLFPANLGTLTALEDGAYQVVRNTNKGQEAGFICILEDMTFFISIGMTKARVENDYYALAAYLTTRNLIATAREFKGEKGDPLSFPIISLHEILSDYDLQQRINMLNALKAEAPQNLLRRKLQAGVL